jgi:PHD/YefM family antitoxin component YafN of YafNO toxin-antitoxin module
MDIHDIKQFIPEDGEKIILMENGKPVVVLMSFNTYKKECKSVKQDKIHHNEEIHQETKKELTIEDLPF